MFRKLKATLTDCIKERKERARLQQVGSIPYTISTDRIDLLQILVIAHSSHHEYTQTFI